MLKIQTFPTISKSHSFLCLVFIPLFSRPFPNGASKYRKKKEKEFRNLNSNGKKKKKNKNKRNKYLKIERMNLNSSYYYIKWKKKFILLRNLNYSFPPQLSSIFYFTNRSNNDCIVKITISFTCLIRTRITKFQWFF